MPSLYQPRRGGSIEVVSEKAASEIVTDLEKRPDSTEYIEPEEKFINDYIQQNSKRIQSASSSVRTASSLSNDGNIIEQKEPINNQRRLSRHASAHRLFEVNEWEEQQKRLKQKIQTGESNTNYSYNEIKATTQELMKDYEQLINKYDFETLRRREFIYRNYRCNVREPFLVAKTKQFQRLDKTRLDRNRFKAEQYTQYLQFINKHRFITQDDYDKREYDAMAQYDDKTEEIHTTVLSDPTLLPYHKWINERRTVSSIGCRSQTQKIADPRRVVSEQGFRYYHRTATPLSNGRSSQSALSWQMHDQTHIDSPVRRLASAKCYHIEQKSQNPTNFDPIDRSLSYLHHRTVSSSAVTA
ncbi:unnamed protein product [Rotaria sp. Silwood1]|nr:unnamed protein product [Rotaria sp. Silwood1]CAF1088340.1 unnamed protein product [Rotaria sp. Silwood1]CAF1110675.1 unnamed protein product [Rotaria sp. Silwood1]CAF3444977.1 unnamed protein product [Rotaria sp. Silwood1]CAF3446967.1 unnamed protein product [Rotaria sp. Silwood1]